MSETPKHTPGPWYVSGAVVTERPLSIDTICAMQISNRPNWLPDAHLIAAAPEMLDFIKVFRLAKEIGREDEAWLAELADRIIDKAEGRQP